MTTPKTTRQDIDDGQVQILCEPSGLPVEIVDADPAWTVRFEDLRLSLLQALGPSALRIDHVGSTAVPGLAAKPIIDIQVSVPDVEDESAYRGPIEALGWPLCARELGHRYFRPPTGAPRVVQVHVCGAGSTWERDHLLFRDYLRSHPERAAAYERLKRELAMHYADDRIAYTDAKGEFIQETLGLAEVWADETGWSVDAG